MAHELGLGAGNVDEVVIRLDRGGEIGLAVDGQVVIVPAPNLMIAEAHVRRGLALHHLIRVVREGPVGLIDCEGEAARTGLHTVQHRIDLNRRKQVLKALRADADLHEAIDEALVVVGSYADVLAKIACHVIGHGLLDELVDALEQLAERIRLVFRVVREGEVLVGSVGCNHVAV